MSNLEGSTNLSLNKMDWTKIGKGLLIAIAGAIVVFLTNFQADVDWNALLGQWGPTAGAFAGAIISVVVNLLRKFIVDNSK